MEVSWWWLLTVPLFFGLGWVSSQLDSRQLLSRTRHLPESYFAGLNHLLNDRPEQAVLAFEEVARLDPDTADLYFALGNLFRRRGETERAIRIHRNLLERADLPQAQRELALFNLGKDYLSAGIFDRAENAFATMAGTAYARQAQRELARLYEKESNWPAAIAGVQAFLLATEPETPEPEIPAPELQAAREDLSHYACEQAQIDMQAAALPAAKAMLDLAQASDANNPRIDIYRAQLHFKQGEADLALALLQTTVSKSVALAPIAVQTVLQACEKNVDKTPTSAQLSAVVDWARLYPSVDTVRMLLPVLAADSQAAERQTVLLALAAQLKQPPQRLASARTLLAHAAAYPEHQATWQADALQAIDALVARYDKPTCTSCGFKSSRHQWRCPGCARWNTIAYSAQT